MAYDQEKVLDSGEAYKICAILIRNGEPMKRAAIVENPDIEIKSNTFSQIVRPLKQMRVVKDKETGDSFNSKLFEVDMKAFYDWWRSEVIKELNSTLSEFKDDDAPEDVIKEIEAGLKRFQGTDYEDFFLKWIQTYAAYVRDSTLEQMVFMDIVTGAYWERNDLGFRNEKILSELEADNLADALRHTGREFTKMEKEWYGVG